MEASPSIGEALPALPAPAEVVLDGEAIQHQRPAFLEGDVGGADREIVGVAVMAPGSQ